MVVRGEGVPDAVLVVVVLAMADVLRVAHRHLFATVPERTRGKKKIYRIGLELCKKQTNTR